MMIFRGYNLITDTSKHNMLRVQKREHILGPAIVCGQIFKDPASKQCTLHFDLSQMSFEQNCWLEKLIDDTLWLTKNKSDKNLIYSNSKKLRIYKMWLYLNGTKRAKKVLKYMYSPLFVALCVMFCGHQEKDSLALAGEFISCPEDRALLKKWFLELYALRSEDNGSSLVFAGKERLKLLTISEPVIKQLPITYHALYDSEVQNGKFNSISQKITY